MTSGFQKGDLIILAARPAMGKTSFALNIARTAAQVTAEPVAIFSLEMSKEQLVKRFIFAEARIESGLVTRGQLRDSDWAKLTTAWADLHKLPLFIDDASFLTPARTPGQVPAPQGRARSRHDRGRLPPAHGLGRPGREPAAGNLRHQPIAQGSGQGAGSSRPRPLPVIPRARGPHRPHGLSSPTFASRAPSSRTPTW